MREAVQIFYEKKCNLKCEWGIRRNVFLRQGTGRVTEREICSSYKHAKYKNRQIGILAELNGMDWIAVAGILIRNGEKIPRETIARMYRKLDALEIQIAEKEREYERIAGIMKGGVNGCKGN